MAVAADFFAADLLDEGCPSEPRARAGSLLRSLLLLTLFAVLLAGAGSAWYVYRGVTDVQLARSIAQQTDEVEMLARLLSARVEQQQKVLLTLAESVSLNHLQDGASLAQVLRHQLPLAAWFDSVAVMRADGSLLVYMRGGQNRSLASLEADERELLQRTLAGGKPMVGSLLQAGSDDLRLIYTAPLRTSAGEVAGVIAGGLRLSPQTLLPPAAVDGWSASRLMLVAPDGSIVAHSNPARWLGHVRDETGLGASFASALQLPVQSRSVSGSHGGYLYTLAGMPLPQWFLLRVTRLETPPLWGLSGWGSQALLGVLALALLTVAAMVLLAYPWMELSARATQMLQRPVPGEMQRPAHLPPPYAWGEVAVLWRVLHALSRQRDAQSLRAARSRNQTVTMLEEAGVAIAVTRDDRVELLGTQAARILGYLPQELQGYPIRQLCASDDDHRRIVERIGSEMHAYGQFDGEVCLMRKDGSPVWLRLQGRGIVAAHSCDADTAVVWMVSDATDLRRARSEPGWQAMHDPLTQLPNREALTQRLQHWLDGSRKAATAASGAALASNAGGVLLFLDLDHFASVNDIAGHDAGDVVLRHFARLLETQVRPPASVMHLGGDEFAVLLPEATPRQGRAHADRLCAAVSAWEVAFRGQRFWLEVSIGMVVLDAQQSSVAAVLHAADMACYEAKRQGRGRIYEHSPACIETTIGSDEGKALEPRPLRSD